MEVGNRVLYAEQPELGPGTVVSVTSDEVEVQWDDGDKDFYYPEQLVLA